MGILDFFQQDCKNVRTKDEQNGEMNEPNENFRSKILEILLFVLGFHFKLTRYILFSIKIS
jgi:hypothetical protein